MHRFDSTPGRLRQARPLPLPLCRPKRLPLRWRWLALAVACLGASVQAQPAGAGGPLAAPVAEATVLVTAFTVQGNTLLAPALLQALLQPWRGPRTLVELGEAAQAVQAQYSRAGYGAVVAYLPPQPVADGTVTIAVLEGRLSRVSVQGQQRLSDQRVRAALPTLVEGRTPRVRRIDAELQLANENPGRSFGVLLGPGVAPGEVEATVKVVETAVQRFTGALDNSGNEATGPYRLSLGWLHADISGHDDVLNAQVQFSPTELKAVQVLSLGYRLPLVQQLAALDLFAAYSDVDGGIQPSAAGDLRFAGQGRIFGARGTAYLPRWGEVDQRLSVGLESRLYLNTCSVGGLPDGACGPSGNSVLVQPLSVDYTAQAGGALPASLQLGLSHNLALGGHYGSAADFEAVRPGASRYYTALRASAQVSTALVDDWSLTGRLALQHTQDLLVPGEQFGLGGASSVRGYADRELSGDSGVALAIELSTPRLAADSTGAADLRLLAFADGGQVHNQGDLACRAGQTRCTLTSLGLGARLGWRTLQARLFVAQARQDGADTRVGDWRTHLIANLNF
jgi:hemolysin activation/secretion protein